MGVKQLPFETELGLSPVAGSSFIQDLSAVLMLPTPDNLGQRMDGEKICFKVSPFHDLLNGEPGGAGVPGEAESSGSLYTRLLLHPCTCKDPINIGSALLGDAIVLGCAKP